MHMSQLVAVLQQKGLLQEEDAKHITQSVMASTQTEEEALSSAGVGDEDILVAKGEQWGMPTRWKQGGNIHILITSPIP